MPVDASVPRSAPPPERSSRSCPSLPIQGEELLPTSSPCTRTRPDDQEERPSSSARPRPRPCPPQPEHRTQDAMYKSMDAPLPRAPDRAPLARTTAGSRAPVASSPGSIPAAACRPHGLPRRRPASSSAPPELCRTPETVRALTLDPIWIELARCSSIPRAAAAADPFDRATPAPA